LMMVGFEPLIYFNWFKTVWPFEHPNTNMHHLTQLAISLYLLTFGPGFLRFLGLAGKRNDGRKK